MIFGASGATGHELVKQALNKQYNVTAFVRNPLKLQVQHPNLEIVQGDLDDYPKVASTIKGHYAVLSALGASSPLKYDPSLASGMSNIIKAMEAVDVTRLVYLSFVGVRGSRNRAGIMINHIAPFILVNEIKGHEVREKMIKDSKLCWTIVRPPVLTRGTGKGKWRAGTNLVYRGFAPAMSRTDVASFMLEQLNKEEYLYAAPFILY